MVDRTVPEELHVQRQRAATVPHRDGVLSHGRHVGLAKERWGRVEASGSPVSANIGQLMPLDSVNGTPVASFRIAHVSITEAACYRTKRTIDGVPRAALIVGPRECWLNAGDMVPYCTDGTVQYVPYPSGRSAKELAAFDSPQVNVSNRE